MNKNTPSPNPITYHWFCQHCNSIGESNSHLDECPYCGNADGILYTQSYIKCDCGENILNAGYNTHCPKCGAWYNGFGDRLTDPKNWDPYGRYGKYGPKKHEKQNAIALSKCGDFMAIAVAPAEMPDIHLYLDVSGSTPASDSKSVNYMAAFTTMLRAAKTMHTKLFVSLFNHLMLGTFNVNIENRSDEKIIADFEAIMRKAWQGGTNIKEVWNHINSSPERTRELSVIVTDFEWWATPTANAKENHPENLYYMPVDSIKDISPYSKTLFNFIATIQGVTGTDVSERILLA